MKVESTILVARTGAEVNADMFGSNILFQRDDVDIDGYWAAKSALGALTVRS